MSGFWKRKRDFESDKNRAISFVDWAMDSDFFLTAHDPADRTFRLLKEIQKRSLAEQVFILSQPSSGPIETLGMVPSGEHLMLDRDLIHDLFIKIEEHRRILTLDDFAEDLSIKYKLQQSHCATLLISPLSFSDHSIDALILINYSLMGGSARVVDFSAFVSSVMALSLQNTRLYMELKRKNEELTAWSRSVEERIEEETKTLLEKEIQYHALFEGSNEGILVHDGQGNLIEANRSACRLLGYAKDELLPLPWNVFGVGEGNADAQRFFQETLERKRTGSFETMLRRKDGTVFNAELSSRRVHFQRREVIQTIIRNVSIQKELEENLKDSKEKYRVLIESSPVGVFILRNGIIQFINQEFEKLTGFSRQELIGRNLFDLVMPEDRGMASEREARRQKGEDLPERYELRYLCRNGISNWGEFRNRRVVLGGNIVVLGTLIDITQRKQIEGQWLENQKMESIGTLAGGVAHDFNNLLGGILGYASLLLSEMTNDHPFYNDVYTIAETAKRAADLTNRLLAFARGGKYQVRSIDLNRIVQDIMAKISPELDRSVVVEIKPGKSLWMIRGDLQQIHQVVLNVCLNARDSMPDGGHWVIETSNRTLEDSFLSQHPELKYHEYVCLTISDTGVGMDETIRSRIFEPFFTTKPSHEGKGLGMAVVYGIVKNHEGIVWVQSQLGKGSEVTILLPRLVEAEPTAKTVAIGRSVKPTQILLVDDEPVIREVGRRMLEKDGFNVTLAKDGKEAVEIFEKLGNTFDLVLLDWSMPVMGGKETFRRLQAIDPDVKVAYTSGYGPFDSDANPDIHFIQKPFQTSALIEAIHRILSIS